MLATMSATRHCFVLQCNKNEKAKTRQNFLQWLQARQGEDKKNTEKRSKQEQQKKNVCCSILYVWDCWPNCIVRIEIPVE